MNEHAAQKILEGIALFGVLVIVGAVYLYWLAVGGEDI